MVLLNEDVYASLKHSILSLSLQPGDVLSEREIAGRMSVSRTPVREALQRLERDGLVKRYPRRGMVVTELLLRDIVEAFQIREFIEPPAAAIAAQAADLERLGEVEAIFARLDPSTPGREAFALHNEADARLHALVVEATGNTCLVAFMSNLSDICQRARSLGTPARFQDSIAEHKLILDALRRADAPAAELAMRAHLLAARQRITQLV